MNVVLEIPRGKIAVAPLDDPDTTESGLIVIPDVAKERVDQGIVKHIGGNVEGFALGDHVLFSGYAGTLVYVQDEGRLIILPAAAITAKILDDPCDVPGLYFKSRDGEYFTATYEQAITLCAEAVNRYNRVHHSKRQLKIHTQREEPYEDDNINTGIYFGTDRAPESVKR